MFGFAPAIVNSMVGHVSMATAGLLPVIVSLNIAAWTTTKRRRVGIGLGLAALAQVLIGEEILFQAGLATFVMLVVQLLSRPKTFWSAVPGALWVYAWALAVFLPLAAYPLYTQLFGPMRSQDSPFWIDYFAADLTSFTTRSENIWNGPANEIAALPGGGPAEHLVYLGLPLLLTCLAMILLRQADPRVRAAGAGFVTFAVLSMGGTLWVHGEQTKLAMPYHLLGKVPVLERALPSRLGVVTAMFAAALLALALDALACSARSSARTLAAAGLVGLVAVTLLPRPLAVEPVPDIPRYFSTAARELPHGTRAFVVPVATPHHTEPMRWQQAADFSYSTPDGYFLAPSGEERRTLIGVNPGPIEQVFVSLEEDGTVPAITPELSQALWKQLDDWGVTTVILGPSVHFQQHADLLTRFLGEPRVDADGVKVWFLAPA
ncbi:hypothetical protein Apa02nite_020010 [Actinoplanes palleronii]|uniref:Uncharacterized protein n=1 Tax=Actinoplanes palleronii TaxID=113570 RepID=A0ABQ4B5G5_9ACTN|nr:hypothetical protein Apa02nite_020010 [Actinoplanes palleronii]